MTLSGRPLPIALIQSDHDRWLRFERPLDILAAERADAVADVLAETERRVRTLGLHAVGFVTYEAGAAFGLPVKPQVPGLPLAWFALCAADAVTVVDGPRSGAGGGYALEDLHPSIGAERYQAAFQRIKRALVDGDSYQVNFTFHLRARFRGDEASLFADLVAAQGGRYSALLRCGRWTICSASPELFFARSGEEVIVRPMKGTSARGRTVEEDERAREGLHRSAKQRAENVMIVDMIRNDLGRIAEVGSVRVPALFETERYPRVWQMTSTVRARSGATLAQLFEALHPSASVTGAPKINTMALLRDLEAAPRGVYTGAIGHVQPDGAARFNVAIRTAVIDRDLGQVEFGTGSGVVWDSVEQDEYAECLLKASALGRRPAVFELLETMRWSPEEGFMLLPRHLARLRASAGYFGVAFQPARVDAALAAAIAGVSRPQRVRLLVDRSGHVRVERTDLVSRSAEAGPLRVAFARQPIDDLDPFLFHKTTARSVYERLQVDGFDDTLLWNDRNEVTEATTANLIVEIGGRLVTPPVECGLLAGTVRGEMLDRGELQEALITKGDVVRARRLWLTNSVHGRRPARVMMIGEDAAGAAAAP